MAVNVQREAGGGVAEIALHGLDIVAAFNGDDGVAVAQIVKPLQIFLQNCEMKSNRAGLGCANLNKVPEDTNSFLTDKAKLALSKFWPRNEQAKMNKFGTRRILLLLLASFSRFC